MVMLANDTVVDLIERSLALLSQLAPSLRDGALQAAAPPAILESYAGLVAELQELREQDTRLGDDAWSWIFLSDSAEQVSAVQLYGRLSFINGELFHFL